MHPISTLPPAICSTLRLFSYAWRAVLLVLLPPTNCRDLETLAQYVSEAFDELEHTILRRPA
jgi:hypothetical protein